MSEVTDKLAGQIEARFRSSLTRIVSNCDELTYEVPAGKLLEVCRALRDEPPFRFEQLMDVCGVDYLGYGEAEWQTRSATRTGFSRGAERNRQEPESGSQRRFAVTYHLLSVSLNQRLRLRTFCDDSEPPVLDSLVAIWSSANWFEREAFDLYGLLFNGHPDMRRILTDYGFVGYPFRKDFPLSGNVEVRYDPEKRRVVYQPVSIEPRVLVPRVIREDVRYEEAFKEASKHA